VCDGYPLPLTPGSMVSTMNAILEGKQPLSATEQVMHSFPFPHYQAQKVP